MLALETDKCEFLSIGGIFLFDECLFTRAILAFPFTTGLNHESTQCRGIPAIQRWSTELHRQRIGPVRGETCYCGIVVELRTH